MTIKLLVQEDIKKRISYFVEEVGTLNHFLRCLDSGVLESTPSFKELFEAHGENPEEEDLASRYAEWLKDYDALRTEQEVKEFENNTRRYDNPLWQYHLRQIATDSEPVDDLERSRPVDFNAYHRGIDGQPVPSEDGPKALKQALDKESRAARIRKKLNPEQIAGTTFAAHYDPNYVLRFTDPVEGERTEPPTWGEYGYNSAEYEKALEHFVKALQSRAIPPRRQDFKSDEEFRQEELKHKAALETLINKHIEEPDWQRKVGVGMTGAWNPDQFINDPDWKPIYKERVITKPDGSEQIVRVPGNINNEEDLKKFNGWLYRKDLGFYLDPHHVKKLQRRSISSGTPYQQLVAQYLATNVPYKYAQLAAKAALRDREVNASDLPAGENETPADAAERHFNADISALSKSGNDNPSWEDTRRSPSAYDIKKLDPDAGSYIRDFGDWLAKQQLGMRREGKSTVGLHPSTLDYFLAWCRVNGKAEMYLSPELQIKAHMLFGDKDFSSQSGKSSDKANKKPVEDFINLLPARDMVTGDVLKKAGQVQHYTKKDFENDKPIPQSLAKAWNDYKKETMPERMAKKPSITSDDWSRFDRPVNMAGVAPGQTTNVMRLTDSEQHPMDSEEFVPPPMTVLNERKIILRNELRALVRSLKKIAKNIKQLQTQGVNAKGELNTRAKQLLGVVSNPIDDRVTTPKLLRLRAVLIKKINLRKDFLKDTLAKIKYVEQEDLISEPNRPAKPAKSSAGHAEPIDRTLTRDAGF